MMWQVSASTVNNAADLSILCTFYHSYVAVAKAD